MAALAAATVGVEADTSAPDLLTVIIDTNAFAWHACSQETEIPEAEGGGSDSLSFEQALQSILVLCNAHLALRFENQVVIYVAGQNGSTLLYSSVDAQRESIRGSRGAVQLPPDVQSESSNSNSYQMFRMVDDAIAAAVRNQQDEEVEVRAGMQDKPVAISSALSKALCHLNRIAKDEANPPMRARVLILSVSGETSTQYIPIMNCIFAAQKASIPIDVCKIFGDDTVFLQQASHLTKASYYRLERRSGLLQYLLMVFLPGIGARKYMHLPTQEQIDLRAACFCHKKIVDIGYVCSVCLSIFCQPIPVCKTCRTKFPMATLRSLMGSGGASLGGAGAAAAKKRKVGPGSATPNGTPAAKRSASAASNAGTPA